MNFTDIELYAHPNRIEVWYKSQHYATFGVKEGNQLVISIPETKQNDIELNCESLSANPDLLPLDIYILVQEVVKDMALPRSVRTRREPIKTQMLSPGRVDKDKTGGDGNAPDHIAEGQRDGVLNALLDSLLDTPKQTPKFRAAETKRIAERFNEPIMAVAGVRANLTRGSYGDLDARLTKRRRARARAAKLGADA